MTNLAQIADRTWAVMIQNSDSSTYNSTVVYAGINEVLEDILSRRIFNELTNSYIDLDVLDFMKAKYGFTVIGDKILDSDFSVGDIIMTLEDTTDMENASAIKIGDDIIEYTGITGDDLTGISTSLLPHKKGDTVKILYKMPSNFGKAEELYTMSVGRTIEIEYIDSNKQLSKYYEVLSFNGSKYINHYNINIGEYYIRYVKDFVKLENSTDDGDMPDYILLNVVPYISGGRMIKDPDLRAQLLTEGYGKLATANLKYKSNTTSKGKIEWKRPKFSSVRI